MPAERPKRALLVAAACSAVLLTSIGFSLRQPALQASVSTDRPEHSTALEEGSPPVAQAAPSAVVVAPSAAMGDFGASQGNVWDMDSTDDIVWTQSSSSGQTIKLTKLPGSTIVRGEVPEGKDLAIAFYADSAVNLPSSQYHHLTYKLKVAAEGNCQTNGRVIYAKSWPNWMGNQIITHGFLPHEAPMFCPFGQTCTYYMDLSSNSNSYNPTWFTDPPPWPTDPVKAFAMWPHEQWANCAGGPDYFDLDYVYLTGDIVAREQDGYTYNVQWRVADPDGGTVTSTLRYQAVAELRLPTDSPVCNSGNFTSAWTFITQKVTNLTPPSLPKKLYLPLVTKGSTGGGVTPNESYTWNLSGGAFEDGMSYYVCIRVDDGASQAYAVSSAPVIRVPVSPVFGHE